MAQKFFNVSNGTNTTLVPVAPDRVNEFAEYARSKGYDYKPVAPYDVTRENVRTGRGTTRRDWIPFGLTPKPASELLLRGITMEKPQVTVSKGVKKDIAEYVIPPNRQVGPDYSIADAMEKKRILGLPNTGAAGIGPQQLPNAFMRGVGEVSGFEQDLIAKQPAIPDEAVFGAFSPFQRTQQPQPAQQPDAGADLPISADGVKVKAANAKWEISEMAPVQSAAQRAMNVSQMNPKTLRSGFVQTVPMSTRSKQNELERRQGVAVPRSGIGPVGSGVMTGIRSAVPNVNLVTAVAPQLAIPMKLAELAGVKVPKVNILPEMTDVEQQAQQEHPVATFAGQTIGGLAGLVPWLKGAGAASKAMQLAQRAKVIEKALPTIGKYAVPLAEMTAGFGAHDQAMLPEDAGAKERLQTAAKSLATSIPFSTTGGMRPSLQALANAGIGFGTSKMEGASNLESMANAAVLAAYPSASKAVSALRGKKPTGVATPAQEQAATQAAVEQLPKQEIPNAIPQQISERMGVGDKPAVGEKVGEGNQVVQGVAQEGVSEQAGKTPEAGVLVGGNEGGKGEVVAPKVAEPGPTNVKPPELMTPELPTELKKAYKGGVEAAKRGYKKQDRRFWEDRINEGKNADIAPEDAFYGNDDAARLFEMGLNGREPEYVTGWRYGKLPESGRSYNFRDQQNEKGVSLMALHGEPIGGIAKTYEMFNSKGKPIVHVSGWLSGYGADGEPIVIDAKELPANDYARKGDRYVYQPKQEPINAPIQEVQAKGTVIPSEQPQPLSTERLPDTTKKTGELPPDGLANSQPITKSSEVAVPSILGNNPTMREGPGALTISRIKNVAVDVAEPGKERLRGLLNTAKTSPNVSEGTKATLSQQEPRYEQQKTRAMKDRVLNWFSEPKPAKEDPVAWEKDLQSRVAESERFIRDPAEDMDSKGAITAALLEHYRNTGNDAAGDSLVLYMDPVMRGAGRMNQAASMLNSLSGNGWVKMMDAYLAENKATISEPKRTEIVQDFKNAAKISDEMRRNKALHKVIGKVAKEVPLKLRDWVDAYRYSNMLSNLQSTERNIYGNIFNTFVTRPASLIRQGKIKQAKTYFDKAWGQLLSGRAFKDAIESFSGSDFSKYADMMDRPKSNVFDAVKREQGPNSKFGRGSWKAITAIPRSYTAQDAFFGSIIGAGEYARLIEARKSPEIAKMMSKRLEERYLYREKLGTKDASLDAMSQALDFLGTWIDKARNAPGFVGPTTSLFVPFLRTIIKLAKFSVAGSPLAYLGRGMNENAIAKAHYGKEFSKLDVAEKEIVVDTLNERKALASIGTAVTLSGLAMAATGNTTWNAPTDEQARKLFYKSGRRPFSFRVGSKWYPMSYLGPFFLGFAIPAAAREAFIDNPNAVDDTVLEKLGNTASGVMQLVMSLTPISGLGKFLDALNGKPDRTISSTVGSIASQFVPLSGMQRWVNKIVDPTIRKPVTFLETIQSGIPGLSDTIAAYTDSEGMDVTRPLSDIWMPYTIGEEGEPPAGDMSYEDQYQERMGQLKENVKARAEVRAQEKADRITNAK